MSEVLAVMARNRDKQVIEHERSMGKNKKDKKNQQKSGHSNESKQTVKGASSKVTKRNIGNSDDDREPKTGRAKRRKTKEVVEEENVGKDANVSVDLNEEGLAMNMAVTDEENRIFEESETQDTGDETSENEDGTIESDGSQNSEEDDDEIILSQTRSVNNNAIVTEETIAGCSTDQATRPRGAEQDPEELAFMKCFAVFMEQQGYVQKTQFPSESPKEIIEGAKVVPNPQKKVKKVKGTGDKVMNKTGDSSHAQCESLGYNENLDRTGARESTSEVTIYKRAVDISVNGDNESGENALISGSSDESNNNSDESNNSMGLEADMTMFNIADKASIEGERTMKGKQDKTDKVAVLTPKEKAEQRNSRCRES